MGNKLRWLKGCAPEKMGWSISQEKGRDDVGAYK